MASKLELWVAAVGILVAGVVVASWLMVGPTMPSRMDIAVLVAVVTSFAWAAAVVGGRVDAGLETAPTREPPPRRSAYGEIHC